MTDPHSMRPAARGQSMERSDRNPCEDETLGDVLLHLTDDFAEYEVINAFLCKAFTSVMSTSEPQSGELIQGALYMAEFLQTRVWQLKSRLESAREQYVRESADRLA